MTLRSLVGIGHGAGDGESSGTAACFLDGIIELSGADVAGDAAAVLLQIEVRAALGSVVHVLANTQLPVKSADQAEAGARKTIQCANRINKPLEGYANAKWRRLDRRECRAAADEWSARIALPFTALLLGLTPLQHTQSQQAGAEKRESGGFRCIGPVDFALIIGYRAIARLLRHRSVSRVITAHS